VLILSRLLPRGYLMGSRRWACSRRMDDIAEGSGLFVTSCLESTWRAGGLGVGGLFPGDQPRHELSAAAGDVSDACLLQQRTPRGQALRPWSELLFSLFWACGACLLRAATCAVRSCRACFRSISHLLHAAAIQAGPYQFFF
jgi:hypothetical protein